MLLKELKPVISADKIIIYLEIAEPILFENDDSGEYYNADKELFETFGNYEIEQIYSDDEAINIDLKVL